MALRASLFRILNPVLNPVAVADRSQQTKALKFENEAPDRGISRIAEVFFQPLGGKLFAAISREDKLPERPLLLGNLPLPQRLLESL